MKILVILAGHEMNPQYINNITVLNNYMTNIKNAVVEYCGISNSDDFANYESVIQFKYKIINTKQQMSKVCDFITDYASDLEYDWYIKFRPDFMLLGPINFAILSDTAVNARTRVYRGPKRIQYGMSVNGKGIHANAGDCNYDDIEREVILDDCLYIFHHNVIQKGAFYKINSDGLENEWFHTQIWRNRGIDLNIVGINAICVKYDLEPGHINM